MTLKDCFYIGIIVSKLSLKGEVLTKFDSDDPEMYEEMESVFIALDSNLAPFFIERSSLHKSDLSRVRFEGVDTEADADALPKHKICLSFSALPLLMGNQFYYHEVMGFTVEDTQYGYVGKITAVNGNTFQVLSEIEDEAGRQIPIPINFLEKINRQNQKLIVFTPEELIALYQE